MVVGMFYLTGHGASQDYKKAVHYFELAAKQGFAAAQSSLGLMYYNGNGVPQNYKKRVHYYELAAKQGVAQAHYGLVGVYALGQAVPQDVVKAYAHAIIAYALDSSKSKNKEILESKLTPSQKEKAQELAEKMWEELQKGVK